MKLASLLLAAVLGLLVFSAVLPAAEPAGASLIGKWVVTFESDRGPLTVTYIFKSDGSKLTGTSSSDFTGEGVLTDIKLDKESVAFAERFTFDGMPQRFDYTGTLKGDELQLKRAIAATGYGQQGVAKRVKENAPAVSAAPAEAPKAAAPAK